LALASSAPQRSSGRNGGGSNRMVGLSDSISRFNSKFYEHLAAVNSGNIFYSPFSIHMLLSQVYLGSPKTSETSAELASLLQLNQDDDDYLLSYLQFRTSQEDQLKRLHQVSMFFGPFNLCH
jgi:Serpin (serine protease inhibitor)